MKGVPKVYPWRDFLTYVHKALNHDLGSGSHPVVDAIAIDLLEGHLIRRDDSAHPTGPWQLPSELAAGTYLHPSEVNARPIMKDWLLEWSPAHQLSTAEEVKTYGWKGALQLEEKRIRVSFNAMVINIAKTRAIGLRQ